LSSWFSVFKKIIFISIKNTLWDYSHPAGRQELRFLIPERGAVQRNESNEIAFFYLLIRTKQAELRDYSAMLRDP
jgi:hypothetical protein